MLLDPPRTGAREILSRLDFGATGTVAYVSCNPATLARDAGILIREKGFSLAAAGVIDMFPHTAHVESIAVFDRAA
jgi:23S rRNA (uracil1939-C5)-methyltransferase